MEELSLMATHGRDRLAHRGIDADQMAALDRLGQTFNSMATQLDRMAGLFDAIETELVKAGAGDHRNMVATQSSSSAIAKPAPNHTR